MAQDSKNPDKNEPSQVIDFTEVRAQKLDEKRRKTERIFFKHLMGIYCVSESTELKQVELMDVSEEGLSFQIPFSSREPWPRNAKEIPLRLYFSQDTYLPVLLKIQNSRPYIENGVKYLRFGCAVDKSLSSYEAFVQFVRFMGSYSQHAHKDTGKVTLFYL
jgi:hypothetical protein